MYSLCSHFHSSLRQKDIELKLNLGVQLVGFLVGHWYQLGWYPFKNGPKFLLPSLEFRQYLSYLYWSYSVSVKQSNGAFSFTFHPGKAAVQWIITTFSAINNSCSPLLDILPWTPDKIWPWLYIWLSSFCVSLNPFPQRPEAIWK